MNHDPEVKLFYSDMKKILTSHVAVIFLNETKYSSSIYLVTPTLEIKYSKILSGAIDFIS